jgi:lysophospholipase L1-like esterase
MKRLLLMVVLAMLVAVPAADAAQPQRVLFIGDSLTGGCFVSAPERAFVSLVSAALPGYVPFVRCSYGGKLAEVPRGLPGARFVVVEIGTNDVSGWPTFEPTPLPTFRAQYVSLLRRIVQPGRRVVLCGTWGAGGGTASAAYDAVIRKLARRFGCAYVPLRGLYCNVANRLPAGEPGCYGPTDAFHPNDAGHGRIAARVLAALHR